MSEPKRDEFYVPDPVRKESDTSSGGESARTGSVGDDRGGFRDTAPNPHDEEGSVETATRTTGAFLLAGAMWPAVILAIIALAIILYFVLR